MTINRDELMTVGNLIDLLGQYNKDMIVGFAHATGDHSGNIAVDSPFDIDEKTVEYSAYVEGMVERDEENEDTETWVVLE